MTTKRQNELADDDFRIEADCCFCGSYTEDAIKDGWIPSYFDAETDEECDGPICLDCQTARLTWTPYGPELKPT